MQQGRGGMGTHKHGVSGRPSKNAKYKAESLRYALNEAKLQRRRKMPLLFSSVMEAIKGWGRW